MAYAGTLDSMDSSDDQTHASPLNLLVIGNAGHGKTATSQAILRLDMTDDHEDVARKVYSESRVVHGRHVTVVDTPGMFDDSIEEEDASLGKLVNDFSKAFEFCPNGFHAILVVIRIGTRMTTEEVEALDTLKDMFGKSAFKEHGILIFTHGDQFERKMKGKKTFESWCEEQMGEILKRFQKRCVLFDNVTTDEEIKKRQIDNVFDIIENQMEGATYLRDTFEKTSAKWRLTRNEWMDADTLKKIHAIVGHMSLIKGSNKDGETDLEDLKREHECALSLAKRLTNEELRNDMIKELEKLSEPPERDQHRAVSRLLVWIMDIFSSLLGKTKKSASL